MTDVGPGPSDASPDDVPGPSRPASAWDMAAVRSRVDVDLGARVAAMGRAELEEALLALVAATVPVRRVLGAVGGQVRTTRHSARHARSDLFPMRCPDGTHAEEDVWVEPVGDDRWMHEHEALRMGLRHVPSPDSIQLVDAPVDAGFVILSISGTELCSVVHDGALTVGDVARLEAAATLAGGT